METQTSSLGSYIVLDNIKILLNQFIRCSNDGVFDRANPYEDLCESCSCEREKILELIDLYQRIS